MTRYDPNNCNEDDISAYQSYADHAGGKRSSLQSTVRDPKSPINYGKRRYGVANSYKISSPFESTSAKRRKANHQVSHRVSGLGWILSPLTFLHHFE